MAWSQATISATDLAWKADDKPMLIGNTGAFALDDARWGVGATDWTFAHAADDATGFEAYRLVDGFPGSASKPDTTNGEFTILFDFSSSPIEFDWIGVMNHNLYTLNTSVAQWDIADDDAFSVRRQNLGDINVAGSYSSDRRFAYDSLNTNKRFSNVEYARLGIECSVGTPYIGQIIFGRRRQQQFQPSLPYDISGERSAMDDFRGRDGMLSRQARYKARRELNASWRHSLTTLHSDVEAWWNDIGEGARPFCYVDKPTSFKDDFNLFMLREPQLRYPWTTSTTRDLTIDGIEQGPSFFSLE